MELVCGNLYKLFFILQKKKGQRPPRHRPFSAFAVKVVLNYSLLINYLPARFAARILTFSSTRFLFNG